MAVLSTSSVLIIIAIALVSLAPSSTGDKLRDNEIKHLCRKSNDPEACYRLLKSDPRTANVDARGLAKVSVDLAYNKANKIHIRLNNFARATHDSELKRIYALCSKNYDDAIRDLQDIKRNLNSGADKNLQAHVKDASEEVKNCENVFDAVTSGHARIKMGNQVFEFILSMVKLTIDNLHKN